MISQVSSDIESRILYEDNHLLIINKLPGEIVQADKTGDITLIDVIKDFLKVKYSKPGNVFLGLCHRLDRPTSGIVVFAKTGKALERMSALFREGGVEKHYHAITDNTLPDVSGRLEHYIRRDEKQNKSFAYSSERPNTKKAVLEYSLLAESDRYYLYDIKLITGRHHQIRAQLAACNVHIKGDLKYGFPRSNPDGGICLHSHFISFVHPVSGKTIQLTAPEPDTKIWHLFDSVYISGEVL